MCDSTLDGLPVGHDILRSGPACANIFLMKVNRKSLREIIPTRGMQNVAIENGQY